MKLKKFIKDMNKKAFKGFTLIELLIVMAILGVLAVVVLVAINPVQQLARTRDAGRKSAVAQVGRALAAYYTSHGGNYLVVSNCGSGAVLRDDWMNCLKEGGELSNPVADIAYNSSLVTMPCTSQTISGVRHACQNGVWYAPSVNIHGEPSIVYARLESASEASKCTNPSNPVPWFVWSTQQGRGGLFCSTATARPAPGIINFTD